MASKAAHTTQFIIEKVAPVFNTMGYEATSMANITAATGLTKGAIYGNFENKEHLAIEAFNYNVRSVIWRLAAEMNAVESVLAKFKVMTDFYRRYYNKTVDLGGCPLLNAGVDSNNFNSKIHKRVVIVLKKLQSNVAQIIEAGMENGELKPDLESKKLGARIVSLIQGAVFTANMLQSPQHLIDVMDFIDESILNDWKA